MFSYHRINEARDIVCSYWFLGRYSSMNRHYCLLIAAYKSIYLLIDLTVSFNYSLRIGINF